MVGLLIKKKLQTKFLSRDYLNKFLFKLLIKKNKKTFRSAHNQNTKSHILLRDDMK